MYQNIIYVWFEEVVCSENSAQLLGFLNRLYILLCIVYIKLALSNKNFSL